MKNFICYKFALTLPAFAVPTSSLTIADELHQQVKPMLRDDKPVLFKNLNRSLFDILLLHNSPTEQCPGREVHGEHIRVSGADSEHLRLRREPEQLGCIY
jgi:hypothetical protein